MERYNKNHKRHRENLYVISCKKIFCRKEKKMRFIHMADMHFDSPFTVLSNWENLGDLRRLEQREAFKK